MAKANKSADELERASIRVSRWLVGVVALAYGFRFAMESYSGPSVAWGLALTALAGLCLWAVLWRWGPALADAYDWLLSLLPGWLRRGG